MRCKFCSFSADQNNLIRHHQLHHRRPHHWPCVHSDCVCVFKAEGALRSHLSRYHRKHVGLAVHHKSNFTFKCECCDFQGICSEREFLKHLGNHLKIQETIQCPFLGCDFKTNTYSTFSSHKSRKHKQYNTEDFRTEIQPCAIAETCTIYETDASTSILEELSHVLEEDRVDHFDDETFEHEIANFYLSMQTVLHVSQGSAQTIIQGYRDLLICSTPCAFQSVKEVFKNTTFQQKKVLFRR